MSEANITFPPLTRSAVDSCKHSEWHQIYRAHAIKTTIIPLNQSFIDYLQSDGMQVPLGSSNDAESPSESSSYSSGSSDNEDEQRTVFAFPELDLRVRAVIAKYDGAIFPKLNWSSPQDAAWINAGRHLECVSPADVYLLLKASDFVSHDIEYAYEHCVDGNGPSETFELVLKKWFDVPRSQEFRCFVQDKDLVAICQRDDVYYDFLNTDSKRKEIVTKLLDFWRAHIENTFPQEHYTFDIYFTRDWQRIFIIDFNPFGPQTDALLFDWSEILAARRSATPVMLRLIESQLHASQAMPRHSHNRYPADVVQLSQGKDPATFQSEFNQNLAEALVHSLQESEIR